MGEEHAGGTDAGEPDRGQSISAVIPAYGNPKNVAACIEAIMRAPAPPGEIIVVDDATPDQLVVEDEAVRVLRHAVKKGPGAARNTGARAATGDWILFVDSDIVASADVTERVRRTFIDRPEIDAVFGVYTEACPHRDLVSSYKNLYWRHKFMGLPARTASLNTALMAIRREAFEAAGMFNEASLIGEDRELGNALVERGYEVLLDKHLLGTHSKKFGIGKLLREHFASTVNATLVLLATPVDVRSDDGNVLGASKAFLASLAVAPLAGLVLLAAVLFRSPTLGYAAAGLAAVFVALNVAFLAVCRRYRGWAFAAGCLGLSFIEALVAAAAIAFAVFRLYVLRNARRNFQVNS